MEHDVLKPGLLVNDTNNNLGFFIERVNLFENSFDQEAIWVWKIMWTGPTKKTEISVFIEQVVLSFVYNGIWGVCHNDK